MASEGRHLWRAPEAVPRLGHSEHLLRTRSLHLNLSPNMTPHICLEQHLESRPGTYVSGKIVLAGQGILSGFAAVLATALVYAAVRRISGDLKVWWVALYSLWELLKKCFLSLPRLMLIWLTLYLYGLYFEASEGPAIFQLWMSKLEVQGPSC